MVCCIQINLFSQCLQIVYRINFAQLITDNGISGVERVSGVSERSRTGGNARKRNGNASVNEIKRKVNASVNERKRKVNASVNERKRKVNCGVNERRLKQRLCNAMLTDTTR